MKRRAIAIVLCVTLLALTAGCFSSQYTPRNNGRVAMMVRNGQAGYMRDGKFHRHGFFGSGLEEAVKGNPLAEEAASTYYNRSAWGFVLGVGGLVCAEIGLFQMLEGDRADPSYEPSRTLKGVTAGCAVVGIIGMFVLVSAIPYQSDAVNIFNDGVDVRHAAPPLPQRRPPITPLPSP